MSNSVNIRDRLLVTGPGGGGVAVLSGSKCEVLFPTGSTGLSISGEKAVWVVQDENASSIGLFHNGLLSTGRISDGPLELHNIIIEGDRLLGVATQLNAVIGLGGGKESNRWSFSSGIDSWHISGLVRHHDKLLASAFGRFSAARGYEGGTVGRGEIFDIETGAMVVGGLSQPHSPLSSGGLLWVCNSELGEIHAYDGAGRCQHRYELPGYTRGLAIGRDRIYVGVSQNRNESDGNIGRRFDTAVIAILDIKDGSVLGYAPLPWKEIYAVQISESSQLAEDIRSAALTERAPRSNELAGKIDRRLGTVEVNRSSPIEATSGDIQPRHASSAVALQSAAVIKREAALGGQIAPPSTALEAQPDETNAFLAEHYEQLTMELMRSRDALSRDLNRLRAQRDGLIAERDGMAAERGEAQALVGALQHQIGVAVDRTTQLEEDLADINIRRATDADRIASLKQDAAFLARIRASPVWRYRKPLRFLYRLVSGRQNPAHIRRDLASLVAHVVRSLPLPMALKRSVTRGSLALPGAVSISLLPTVADAKSLHIVPAQPLPGKPDVFVWAVIDWHFRTQRPQHLARALAGAGHRVFYVSNNFVDTSAPGFSVEPLDENGRLFQVHLNVAGAPTIYFGLPGVGAREELRHGFASLLGWAGTTSSISLVQHPFWTELSSIAPNVRRVYDCMDHHAGFENNAPALMGAEQVLLKESDLVIVTSDWLDREVSKDARKVAIIRNACEFDFFSDAPEDYFKDEGGRKVIGYFGAIAEWFDVGLVAEVANAHPDCLVVLVGGDAVDAKKTLANHRNVKMVGEVAYAQLPYWLHGFDVCLLPFQVIPLTLATNPVKVYEYLSAGKPVVSVDLPEMAQFGESVRVAGTHAEFVSAVTLALATAENIEASEKRKAYASCQTWSHRATALDEALDAITEPVVSCVVLTYNNIAFTKACLYSLEKYSDYENLEVIVVDNASSDGSRQFLSSWAAEPSAAGQRRRLILNDDNLGFSAGNNVGLAAATGEVLILLNNDTYVTPGWVRTLCAHLRREPTLGLVGPVTNNIGNEARIGIQYADMSEMIRNAGEYTRMRPGQSIALHTAAFFCVAMPREVYERVGPMDEEFGVGFFEDDDYCRRVHLEGYRVACAEDVFVHHHLSASFDSLGADRKQILFEKNKAIYEAKWGTWTPHVYRAQDKGVKS